MGLALTALAALLAAPVSAAPRRSDPRVPFHHMKFASRMWFSQGSGNWRTSFPLTGLPKNEVSAGSTLDYLGAENLITVVSGEVRLLPWFSFDVEYGEGNYVRGKGYDHDWVHAENYNITFMPSGFTMTQPDHQDFSLSQSSLRTRTKILGLHTYFRVMRLPRGCRGEEAFCQFIDVFAGYGWYKDSFRSRNGQQLLASDIIIATPPVGPFDGLDSTYHFNWEGARVGFREEAVLPFGLTATGRFAFSPYIRYRGEGYWNLRTDLRRGEPSFTHDATGTGLEGLLTVDWSPWPLLTVQGGYFWQSFRAKRGTGTSYGVDGSRSYVDLDYARSDRRGFTAGLALRY